jgi:putative FmdB family regulatory protein
VPTYDYQCRTCGNTIEVIHPMTEDGPAACEVCGGQLRRILYPAGIIFRGSGFYKTDSRSASSASVRAASKPSPPSDAGGGPKGESGGSSTGTGEAKPSPETKTGGANTPAD